MLRFHGTRFAYRRAVDSFLYTYRVFKRSTCNVWPYLRIKWFSQLLLNSKKNIVCKALIFTQIINLHSVSKSYGREPIRSIGPDKNNEYLEYDDGSPFIKNGERVKATDLHLRYGFRNSKQLNFNLSKADIEKRDLIVDFIVRDYRRVGALLKFNQEINKRGGIEWAHNHLGYTFSKTPPSEFGYGAEIIKDSKKFGEATARFANVPFTAKPEGTWGLVGSTVGLAPHWTGKALGYGISSGEKGVNLLNHYQLKDSLEKSVGQGPHVFSELTLFHKEAKERLREIVGNGFKSDAVKNALRELIGNIDGKDPFSINIEDIRKIDPNLRLSKVVDELKKKIYRIENSSDSIG